MFYCSRVCYAKARIGGEGKYAAYWKGKHLPDEVCLRISETNKRKGIEPSLRSVRYGKDNNKWKGEENIGYVQKHKTLTKKYGRPVACEQCDKQGSKQNGRWTIEWAKKQGHEYTCNREDFLWLCRLCHAHYDRWW